MNKVYPLLSGTILLILLIVSATVLLGEERVPWASSRVVGSPEPPLPFVAERVMHEHTLLNTTELDFIPGTSWAVILDQNGKMHGFDRNAPEPLETIADFSAWKNNRTEAYSIEFHPDWKQNHLVYVSLLDRSWNKPHVNVVRFELLPTNPPTLDLASAKSIIDWESTGHNGCDLHFGPDGYLYMSAGDGEVPAPPDPRETGQDISDFLSSILRIDVDGEADGKPYRIPADNPFVGKDGLRPEIWAYGFRNPWKMSFDPRDGALWIGDVGWELWEMVFRVDHPGFNGGWSVVEGPQSIHPTWPKGPTPIEEPIVSHSHSEASSMTGGRVYRGSRFPELRDAYIYGDWGSGKMWALWWKDGIITQHQEIASTPHRIVGFAEDENRELFYINYSDGGVYQLAPNPKTDAQQDFPTRLSETGLFTSTEDYQLAPGVYEFDIAVPMWSDHAQAQRAVAYPNLEKATVAQNYFESPTNAVLVRTLSMEMETGNRDTAKRIETQLLHFDGLEWRGYSYRWNDEQTDGELVAKGGDSVTLTVSDKNAPDGERMQNWRFHARAECNRCHQVAYQKKHGNLNGFSPVQLASLQNNSETSELDRLIDLALIDESAREKGSAKLANPDDEGASLNQRARSYLHANCSHCHRPGSTGAVTMYWPIDFDEKRTDAFGVAPQRGTFGISDANIVSPGKPGHSTLLYRVLTTGTGRMPLIGSHEVDEEGTQLLSEWITSLVESPDTTDVATLDDTSAAIVAVVKAGALPQSERAPLLAATMQSPNVSTRDLFERFLPSNERRQVFGAGFDPMEVLALDGDAARGRELFFGTTGPQCFSCHRKNGLGKDFGPDLSKVADKYSKELLLIHITDPNKYVDPPWKARLVETLDDESYTGFIAREDNDTLFLKTALGTEVIIPKKRITSNTELASSIMPEGTIESLTPQEAADLLEFLAK
jgi:putative heme-binding domain-containing protein